MSENIFSGNFGREGTTTPAPMSLSMLAQLVGDSIRRNPALQQVWVMAELSDVRASGHCYMELIEKDVFGRTTAKMRAQIWQSTYTVLDRKFRIATGSGIVSGLKVMVRGSVTHHNLYGLSFNITDIDPSFTLGDMERLRREILQRLAAENILDANQRLPLPLLPQKIAVISAPGAAGFGDFMNQLTNNPEGFVLYPLLFEAIMQGERTASSVIDALDRIEQAVDFWDCVVIIRGGGATTDLNGFDNLELARKVATFPLPVIVGIGHERDRTVLDEIANVRCKTPTAVAEFLIDRLRGAYSVVTVNVDLIIRRCSELLSGEERRLQNSRSSIPVLLGRNLQLAEARLDKITSLLPATVNARIQQSSARLRDRAAAIPYIAAARIDAGKRQIDMTAAKLPLQTSSLLKDAAARLDNLSGMVRLLSPQNTLKRGYSITRSGGKALTSTEGMAQGEIIETILADGKIISKTI